MPPVELYNLLAGFLGSVLAVVQQQPVGHGRAVFTLGVGCSLAFFGAPATSSIWQLSPATEHFVALVIGLTAQGYLLPGILASVAVLSKAPADYVRKKWGNGNGNGH